MNESWFKLMTNSVSGSRETVYQVWMLHTTSERGGVCLKYAAMEGESHLKHFDMKMARNPIKARRMLNTKQGSMEAWLWHENSFTWMQAQSPNEIKIWG